MSGRSVGARQRVVHERAGDELTGLRVIDDAFQHRLADALADAAMDLAFEQQRVHDLAEIVDHDVAQDLGDRRSRDRPRPRRRGSRSGRSPAGGVQRAVSSKPRFHAPAAACPLKADFTTLIDVERPVGADDGEGAVLELDIGLGRLQQVGGDLAALARSPCRPRGWWPHHRPGSEREPPVPRPNADRIGVALDDADPARTGCRARRRRSGHRRSDGPGRWTGCRSAG